MKKFILIGLLLGSILLVSCGGGTNMQTRRIEVNNKYVQGNCLQFSVETGSEEVPIVCLADNDGYPGNILGLYARNSHYNNGMPCVNITVLFNEPPKGKGLAVNLGQPNMQKCNLLPPQ